MKAIKYLILGLIIGGLLGVGAGINMGKNRPVLSNPFKDDSFSGRMKDTGNDLMRKSGEAMEDAGKAIKDQFNWANLPIAVYENQCKISLLVGIFPVCFFVLI